MNRILIVTVGLAITGAVAGALLAIGAVTILGGVREGLSSVLDSTVLWPAAASVGATIGAMLGPSLTWLFLRHVPLGSAIRHTLAGAAMGILVGFWMGPIGSLGLAWPVAIGPIGAIVAAARLRYAGRDRTLTVSSGGL